MLTATGKYYQTKKAGEQGFTLIEILVVVLVIGILAAISIPLYFRYAAASKAAIAFNGISSIVQYVEARKITSSTGTDYPVSADITISDLAPATRNFSFTYTGSTVVATGRNDLTSNDVITYNLPSGTTGATWELEGILSGISIPSQ